MALALGTVSLYSFFFKKWLFSKFFHSSHLSPDTLYSSPHFRSFPSQLIPILLLPSKRPLFQPSSSVFLIFQVSTRSIAHCSAKGLHPQPPPRQGGDVFATCPNSLLLWKSSPYSNNMLPTPLGVVKKKQPLVHKKVYTRLQNN